jgi:hypothetical protein
VRRKRDLRAELGDLRQELQVMRAENARLRLERQAPLSLGATAERARVLLADSPDLEAAPGDDSAATTLANAYMIRASILAVCEDLETTIGQLSLRLQTGAPPSELDRRVRDRRRAKAKAAAEVAGTTGGAATGDQRSAEPQELAHARATPTAGALGPGSTLLAQHD